MSTTNSDNCTPGGNPAKQLANPPSNEAGSTDSGVSQSLFKSPLGQSNPFGQKPKVARSPPPLVNTLERDNAELRNKIYEIEQLTLNLNRDLKNLQRENKELKDALNAVMSEKETTKLQQVNGTNDHIEVMYETDEDELNRETGWILNRNKKNKKRKMSKSPLVSPEMKQPIEQLPTGSRNVQQEEKARVSPEQKRPNKELSTGSQNIQLEKKVPRPPPVIISNCNNYQSIRNIMDNNRIKFQATALNSGDIKINVPDGDSYRKLTGALNEEKATWYSYEDKQTRQTKVIVKKLHASCKPEEIKEYLLEKGYKIKEVTQLLKKGDKTPLPLYMLSFERTEDIKKIYAISEILHMKVQIEAVKKSKLIPQCKKCQVYGHTQNFCNKEPRCVKCVGKHRTAECTKQKDAPPKCVNCGEAHPANYRGCIVIKELQKIRNKTRETSISTRPEINSASTRISTKLRAHQTLNKPSRTNPNVTYADALTFGSPRRQHSPISVNDSNNNQTNKILQDILNRLCSQEEKQERALISILQRLTILEKNHGK